MQRAGLLTLNLEYGLTRSHSLLEFIKVKFKRFMMQMCLQFTVAGNASCINYCRSFKSHAGGDAIYIQDSKIIRDSHGNSVQDVGAIQDKTFVAHLNEMSSGGQLVLKSEGHMNLSLRTCSAPKQIPNVTPPPYVDLTLLPISLKTLGL